MFFLSDIQEDVVNHSHYQVDQSTGHYENFLLRANHPTKSIAFWVKYSVFSPDNHPENAMGEVWAAYFDGETCSHFVVKEEFPISQCRFDRNGFNISINEAQLNSGMFKGIGRHGDYILAWEMDYSGTDRPIFLLPKNLYHTSFPKAKSLVALPMASFNGLLVVNSNEVFISDWIGSQNHSWGVQYPDVFAWGQVAGFDNSPNTFLEIATARLKVAPIWSPVLTFLVLRYQGKDYCLNSMPQSIKAKGVFDYFQWRFSTEDDQIKIEGTIWAPKNYFIGFISKNPTGDVKQCLNTQLASCTLSVTLKENLSNRIKLETKHRAAFEIITDDKSHHIPMWA